MKNLSDNMLGAVYMMLSMAGYVFNDAMMKLTASEISLFQSIFIRGLFVSGCLGLIAWQKGHLKDIKSNLSRPLLVRVIGEMGGAVFFLTALYNMPIANVTAILQALPLAVTLAAALILGEAVGWRRYVAISIGFIGMLIIVRPGSAGFDAYSVLALIAVCWIVVRDLATRRLPVRTPSILVGFYTSCAVTLLAVPLSIFQPWHPVSFQAVSYLAAAAGFLFVGTLFGVMTMRVGEIGFISPFRYTILIWAIILGIFVFGEYPDSYTIFGSIIVVAMGIYTLYRERKTYRSQVK